MDKLLTDFPEVRERLDFLNQNLKESAQNKDLSRNALSIPPSGSITIPVVVYIIHDGTTLINISDSQVNDQLTALNNYFLNTGIKFCLATKVDGTSPIPTVNTNDVQTTAGIIHVNNATLSNHYTNSQSALVATASPLITKDRYLRIWVVKSIDGANSGIGGYSMFPNTSPVFDGVVMKSTVFGNGNPNMLVNYNLGKVLVHEIGHYLFLYHTFEGGCSTYFNDCLLDGDRICDTPRVASPNFNCVTGTNSCAETPAILDDLSNYMDYGNNLCQTHFTTGQIERMLAVLNSSRSTLYATENTIYTGTCGSNNLLSATITPSDYTPCASPTVVTTFTAPNASTYSWNFGDALATGSNPNTSSAQSTSHIYTSAANSPYTVSLTVTNNLGESRTSTEKIFVTNCAPLHNSNSYWYVDASSGLDFSSGKAVLDPTFPNTNFANVSCNSQCDVNGNFLFYTNKQKIWNRQNNPINTSDLMMTSNGSSSGQVVIVPKPPVTGNNITAYYVFTQQSYNANTSDIGFRYSIVNVTGTNATMGVMSQAITLPASYGFDRNTTDLALLGTTGLAAVKKCNNNDYWILTTLKKGNSLYIVVFSLTSSGLIYNSERLIVNSDLLILDTGGIEMAPNGNKLFLWHGYGADSYIYDFNKAQGIVDSVFIPIKIPSTSSTYSQIQGCSFSPDSNILYASDYFAKRIYQFNVNSIDVNNTKREIGSSSEGPWGMQLGPDNKLYIAMANETNNQQQLSVIHNPNTLASTENPLACNFSKNGPKANGFTYRIGPSLPNNIDAKQESAYFNPNTANVISKYITGCNTYKFFPNVCGTSFVWTFTNTTLGTTFNTSVTNPTYNFSQNGTYVVTVKDNFNTILGTSSPIIITNSPTALVEGSTTACLSRPNERITNNSTFLNNGETLTWTITSGTGTITGQNNLASVNINWTVLPGTITLTKVNASGCTSTTTKTITAFCPTLNNHENNIEGLTISPNPSNGLFTINTTTTLGKVTIIIYDLRGRIVMSQKNFNFNGTEKTIDLTGCQSGIYMLKLIGSDFTYSHKLIKN
ncbi:M43 family zinc metalloprotease [Flavobacterium sp.]|uniref:M43 family zinc metalloprotease n=1 Tax=Flavobacterium sp. TaxID=239 RepID=UPI002488F065|nr:M43 family zinc metalloprotease [Flavobacterium sp.]MDI1316033.1 M43 family zinc metalloprotease [Flavobacterium sp.]